VNSSWTKARAVIGEPLSCVITRELSRRSLFGREDVHHDVSLAVMAVRPWTKVQNSSLVVDPKTPW
jgi:hypothetical protein